MHIFVAKEFINLIPDTVKQIDLNFNVKKKYDCVIGRASSYQDIINMWPTALDTVAHKIFIVGSEETVSADLYSKIRPTFTLSEDNLDKIPKRIEAARLVDHQKSQAILARENVEEKRNELEKLNEFLTYQDKERSNALKIFHLEEQSKKQHEKQLLFFLDFINSNYNQSSFLDELLQYLWKEIKKINAFYQMGIIVKLDDDEQAVLFRYDDRKYYSQKNIKLENKDIPDSSHLAALLANIYQRPVGKILFWKEQLSKMHFYFYLENQGAAHNISLVQSFVTERLSLLSLIMSRWITEESERILLRQWKNTFKAYKDPIHVVDEEFNIIQASYLPKDQVSGKCYEVLANRQTQCLHCPLLDSTDDVNRKGTIEISKNQFQVHSSSFRVPTDPRKYFLLFYENITEMNKLKSQFIQSEKMSTIGNLANHLAHELNNPLTGLKLTTEYLISEISNNTNNTNNASLLNDLKEVYKATTRSELIIKDLVDFSSEASREMQQIDFAVVLKKTMTLLKSVLRSTRVFIDVKSQMINAQPVYLQQIIFNLIKNSCEALQSKKAEGSIKIYQGVNHASHIDFIIEDNGPGIGENQQVDLFKPFFTTKPEGEGTGLGLYLCSTLMSKMNGELIYDNKFKSGARFILRFKSG